MLKYSRRFYHPLYSLQQKLHKQSIENPAAFWEPFAQEINWHKKYTKAYEKETDIWFPNGQLNMSFNCLDRHVQNGLGEQISLIHDSTATGTLTKFTYKQLQHLVQIISGVLRSKGINHTSKVLIYMPAIPEAIICQLACARIAACHIVVFGGFASKELAIRLQDSKADAILTATFGLEPGKMIDYVSLMQQAIDISSHKPKFQLIFNRSYSFPNNTRIPNTLASQNHLRVPNSLDWHAEVQNYSLAHLSKSEPHPGMECTMVPSNHPCIRFFINFSSVHSSYEWFYWESKRNCA